LLEREIGEAQPVRFRDRPSDEMRIPTARVDARGSVTTDPEGAYFPSQCTG